jgi:hypothetical protein
LLNQKLRRNQFIIIIKATKMKTTIPGETSTGTTGSPGGNYPRGGMTGAETFGNDPTGGNDPAGGTTIPTGVGPAGSNDTLFELYEGIKMTG